MPLRVPHFAAFSIVFLFTVTALAGPKPPKKLDTSEKGAQVFRFKHKAGEKARFTNTVIQELTLEVLEGTLPVPNTATRTSMIADITMETRKVLPNGDGEIVTSYDGLDIEIRQGPKLVDKAHLAPMVAQLKKIESTALVGPRGTQKAFHVRGAPGAQIMNESMRSAFIGASPEFPEKGVKIGEGWRQDIPLKMAHGPIKMEMNFGVRYNFLGYATVNKTRLAVFKMNIELKIAGSPAGVMPEQSIKLSGEGKGLGYLYFDQGAGAVYQSEIEMSQVIYIDLSAQGKSKKMRMSMRTEATMRPRK
jgi:hypothetical protein